VGFRDDDAGFAEIDLLPQSCDADDEDEPLEYRTWFTYLASLLNVKQVVVVGPSSSVEWRGLVREVLAKPGEAPGWIEKFGARTESFSMWCSFPFRSFDDFNPSTKAFAVDGEIGRWYVWHQNTVGKFHWCLGNDTMEVDEEGRKCDPFTIMNDGHELSWDGSASSDEDGGSASSDEGESC
jgi:hypothetical protein